MRKTNSGKNPNPGRVIKVEDVSVSHLLSILFIVWMTGLAMLHIVI